MNCLFLYYYFFMFLVHRNFTNTAAVLIELFPYFLNLKNYCPYYENIELILRMLHSKLAAQKYSSLDSFKRIVNYHHAITDLPHCL